LMRYWGLDFIKCIYCKSFPLKIIVLEKIEEDVDTSNLEFPLCRNYCAYLDEGVKSEKNYPCRECLRIGIKTGVLYCEKCRRWYPIRDGLLYLLKDNKRRENIEKEFLRKWRDKLPEKIVLYGKPFNLSGEK